MAPEPHGTARWRAALVRLAFALQLTLWPPLIWIANFGKVAIGAHGGDALATVVREGMMLAVAQVVLGVILLAVGRASTLVWIAWGLVAVINSWLLLVFLWSASYYA